MNATTAYKQFVNLARRARATRAPVDVAALAASYADSETACYAVDVALFRAHPVEGFELTPCWGGAYTLRRVTSC